MSGITEAHVTQAETWLTEHGHSLAGIAHPDGHEGRIMAVVAVGMNLPGFSDPEAAALLVGVLAYKHSGGKVRTPAVRDAGF